MKYLLFLFLIPAISSAATMQELAAAMMGESQSPFIETTSDVHTRANGIDDLWTSFAIDDYSRRHPTEDAPTIIYHAKDGIDAIVFQAQQDLLNKNRPGPKPNVIYEIGGHGRR